MIKMSVVPVGKAYKFKVGEDDVYVGDPLDSTFHPSLKLSRWTEEVWFKLKFDDSVVIGQKTVKVESEKVRWNSDKLGIDFYTKPPDSQNEGGAAELEIILKYKPSVAEIDLPVEKHNLDFSYQPALTEIYDLADCVELTETHALLKDGRESWRPEPIVGSYAVYHATRFNLHRSKADAEKYKAGKVGHLYRPKLIDAVGKTAYASYNDDLQETGILKMLLPQAFLDSAVYPVTIDPTFGKTSIGGSTNTYPAGYMRVDKATLTEAGTITKITSYTRVTNVGNHVKGGLYANATGSAGALLGNSDPVVATTSYAWVDLTLTTPYSAVAADYFLGKLSEDNEYYAYDAGGTWNYRSGLTYPNLPDPFNKTGGSTDENASIYATYTPTAVAIPIVMKLKPRGGDTRDRLWFQRRLKPL